MAVRNSTCRDSKNYIFANYNGQRYMLITGSFQTKPIIYSTRKKLLSGKLSIPQDVNGKTILITCSKQEDGGLKFELI